MKNKHLTRKINAYLYKSGNSKSINASVKIARGGLWMS